MIFEELLELIGNPNVDSTGKAENFYGKFQKIDKIIEKENNDRAVTTMQEKAEKKEHDEQMRRERYYHNKKVVEKMILKKPQKKHPFESFVEPASNNSSSINQTPQKILNRESEIGKSPVVEYLKKVQKDKLLPHFMPFRKL